MAFTGTASVSLLGAHISKISGVTLAASATGTITNSGGAGDVTLGSTAPTIGDNTILVVQGDELCRASQSSGTITIANGDGANASESLTIWIIDPHSIIQ